MGSLIMSHGNRICIGNGGHGSNLRKGVPYNIMVLLMSTRCVEVSSNLTQHVIELVGLYRNHKITGAKIVFNMLAQEFIGTIKMVSMVANV